LEKINIPHPVCKEDLGFWTFMCFKEIRVPAQDSYLIKKRKNIKPNQWNRLILASTIFLDNNN